MAAIEGRRMNDAQPPKVSVVVPAYNRERLILHALNSVLAQTFADFEILAVDDGSTDGTIQAIQSCTDPRIRCLRHEKNRGAAAARNTGIQAARGEYVAFLDSDDEWLPHKLERQTAALDACGAEIGGNSTWTFDHFPNRKKPSSIIPASKVLFSRKSPSAAICVLERRS